MSERKRAFEGAAADTSNKKLKSDNTSNSNAPSASTTGLSPAELVAQKRAEIAAKLAGMMKTNPALANIGATSARPPVALAAPVPKVPMVPAVAASKVVFNASPSPTVSSGPTPASGSGTPAALPEDLVRRVAEAKRRVADAQIKLAVKDNPYMSLSQAGRKKGTPTEQTQQGAGLKMAAHPLLLDTTPTLPQSKKDRYKPMQPKFASIRANTRNQPSPTPAPPVHTPSPAMVNPYSSAAAAANGELGKGFEGAPRERAGRKFHFNPKGKYVALGNQMRQDQQLEELKARIAESARKAGMDGDMGIEKAIKRAPPPESEWWDEALLPNKSYGDIETLGLERLNIRTMDSPINFYIQHPIPIPAPNEKNKIELKPLMLTKREQKKMRKLRRKQELQDKRDRIRMGLLPPDAPKVRLVNMMKVLTSDAVQDPTRVEARVRREVAARKHTHEKMNAERKLTDEQRREKIENKKVGEEKKGVFGAVYKVLVLSDPAHQFKVRKNADQLNLTGVCIFGPAFNLVYVEGAAKFMRNYKNLMMHRIAWTEAARPRGAEDVVLADEVEGEGMSADGAGAAGPSTRPAAADGLVEGARSLEDNKCFLVWEGALRDREFAAFKAKSCPTDREAREFLGERLKGYWDVAKNWKAEEEEMY